MSNKLYAMESGFLNQLLSDRKYLLEAGKKLTAEGRSKAIADLQEKISINITPKNRQQVSESYYVDGEGTAHIPIVGELTPHAETDICGAYTADALTEYGFIVAATEAADNDDSVESIQYDVNSPGGYVDGLMPAVDSIRSAEKETSAHITGMAASAAYWLASQTDKIVLASPAARVGSIGVAVEIYDVTKALEMEGIQKIVLTSTDAPQKRPDVTTEEGQGLIVDSLDDMHNIFTRYVAEGRGITQAEVSDKYGKGSMLIAENALRFGMVDEVLKVAARRDPKADANNYQTTDGFGNANTGKKPDKAQTIVLESFHELRKKTLAQPVSTELTADDLAAAKASGMSIEAYKKAKAFLVK